jgi:hypothetical protein
LVGGLVGGGWWRSGFGCEITQGESHEQHTSRTLPRTPVFLGTFLVLAAAARIDVDRRTRDASATSGSARRTWHLSLCADSSSMNEKMTRELLPSLGGSNVNDRMSCRHTTVLAPVLASPSVTSSLLMHMSTGSPHVQSRRDFLSFSETFCHTGDASLSRDPCFFITTFWCRSGVGCVSARAGDGRCFTACE